MTNLSATAILIDIAIRSSDDCNPVLFTYRLINPFANSQKGILCDFVPPIVTCKAWKKATHKKSLKIFENSSENGKKLEVQGWKKRNLM
jgi:hypothetical protein